MKKFFALLLIFCMIFTLIACGKKEDERDETPSDYDSEGNLIIIDPLKPLIDAEAKEYRDIYEEDGMAHENSFKIPELNVNLEGANELSEKIYSDFKNEYGTHFSMLDDLSGENVRKGEPYLTVDYDFTYHIDVLIVTVHGCYTTLDGQESNKYHLYYYDALTDMELTLDDYLAYCSSGYNEVAGAMVEAMEESHPDEAVDAHSLAFAVRTEDGEMIKFDTFVQLASGDMAVIPVEVEKTHIDMSQFEAQVQ
ncbi:MAG: hypothetical protein IJC50_04985 [Clostridia bacterium]|nr:hypothetical protein [Clostridia bacterium]